MARRNIGPGPGKYSLPPVVGYQNHDFSRHRNPQYSIGVKLGYGAKPFGPGPKYSMEHMTRYGKAGPPMYSIKSRCKPLTQFQVPGPGTYAVEKVPRMKEARPPAYSMAFRYKPLSKYKVPGPNEYEVPTTIGPKVPHIPANAAYTMSVRLSQRKPDMSPGPAKYTAANTDLYKYKAPNYTISPRIFPPAFKMAAPGPIYLPKLPRKPGYSFGLRTVTEPYITAQDDMPCVSKVKSC